MTFRRAHIIIGVSYDLQRDDYPFSLFAKPSNTLDNLSAYEDGSLRPYGKITRIDFDPVLPEGIITGRATFMVEDDEGQVQSHPMGGPALDMIEASFTFVPQEDIDAILAKRRLNDAAEEAREEA